MVGGIAPPGPHTARPPRETSCMTAGWVMSAWTIQRGGGRRNETERSAANGRSIAAAGGRD